MRIYLSQQAGSYGSSTQRVELSHKTRLVGQIMPSLHSCFCGRRLPLYFPVQSVFYEFAGSGERVYFSQYFRGTPKQHMLGLLAAPSGVSWRGEFRGSQRATQCQCRPCRELCSWPGRYSYQRSLGSLLLERVPESKSKGETTPPRDAGTLVAGLPSVDRPLRNKIRLLIVSN